MTNTANALTARIAALKETIALCTADLRYCNTSAQVQSVNAVIAARKAELAELEEKIQAQDVKKDADAHEAEQVSTCFARGSDVLETSGVHVALPVCTDQMDRRADRQPPASHQAEKSRETLKLSPLFEQAFIKRTVAVLNEAGMGTHSVYIHWFRIDYGCWLDAEEVVKNGGLAEHLEWLGMREADVAELMTRDWDCQDADGLAAQCLTDHGGFDWVKLERLLEAVDAGYDTEIVQAALSLGIPADEVAEAYIGEWNSDEDMAMERWEQYGMLNEVPEAVRGYIDWAYVARDMLLSGIAGHNGHYFYAC